MSLLLCPAISTGLSYPSLKVVRGRWKNRDVRQHWFSMRILVNYSFSCSCCFPVMHKPSVLSKNEWAAKSSDQRIVKSWSGPPDNISAQVNNKNHVALHIGFILVSNDRQLLSVAVDYGFEPRLRLRDSYSLILIKLKLEVVKLVQSSHLKRISRRMIMSLEQTPCYRFSDFQVFLKSSPLKTGGRDYCIKLFDWPH